MIPLEFLLQIPKTDLHLHLDGSEELKKLVFKDTYANLEEYLQGFHYVDACLRDSVSLERVAYELAQDQFNINVRYFEVRFAPQLHAHSSLTIYQVLESVNRGLKKATDEYNLKINDVEEPGFDYGIIVCAMRYFEAFFSPYFEQFCKMHSGEDQHYLYGLASRVLVNAALEARDHHQIPVVGLDIAGAENGYPASDHSEAYAIAHKSFLKKTVHAGEAYGAPSIFQAITSLHAERIGHGFHLFSTLPLHFSPSTSLEDREMYVESLQNFIADNRICIEVCLTSNLQTIPELAGSLATHPFKKMLEKRLAVTLCSDNTTVSNTDALNELKIACETFGFSVNQVRDLVICGWKRSFMNMAYAEKRKVIRKVINRFESLVKDHGLA